MRKGVVEGCPPPSGRKADTAQAVQAFWIARGRIATPVSAAQPSVEYSPYGSGVLLAGALARNDRRARIQNLGAGAIDSPQASEKSGIPAEGNALRGAVEKINIVAAKRLEVKA